MVRAASRAEPASIPYGDLHIADVAGGLSPEVDPPTAHHNIPLEHQQRPTSRRVQQVRIKVRTCRRDSPSICHYIVALGAKTATRWM